MNQRQLEIRDFILSLARTTLGIRNEDIYPLIDQYSFDTIHSMSEIKTAIQKEILQLRKECSGQMTSSDLFQIYGIHTVSDLYDFIIHNIEYGFLMDHARPLPLGGLRGLSKNNRIVTYDDFRIVSFLREHYLEVPEYYRHGDTSLSHMVDVVTSYFLYTKWQLQDVNDTLKYMVGTTYDIVELSATFLTSLGYQVQRYSFSSDRNPEENHLFLCYFDGTYWYYFEPVFVPFRGIHRFSSKEEMEYMILSRFIQYYTISFSKPLMLQKNYTSEDWERYRRAFQLRDEAIYYFRIAHTEDVDSYTEEFQRLGFDKWKASDDLLKQLPRTFEFYHLKRVEAPKKNLSYYAYLSFLYYQRKVQNEEKAYELYQKESTLLSLTLDGLLKPGVQAEENGMMTFTSLEFPVSYHLLEEDEKKKQMLYMLHQSLFSLVYYTPTMENSFFTLGENGMFLQTMGVDLSFIQADRYLYPLHNRKNKYALQIDSKKKATFRGSCSFLQLYHERELYETLHRLGVSVPHFVLLKEIPSSVLKEERLPHPQERVSDYLKRVGILSQLENETLIQLEKDYPQGVRLGQGCQELAQPFSFHDLRQLVEKENVAGIEKMLSFALTTFTPQLPNLQSYLLFFAKQLGMQLAMLTNKNYYCVLSNHVFHVSLAGELEGDSILSYEASLQAIGMAYIDKKPMLDRKVSLQIEKEKKQLLYQYYFAFFAFTSLLQVLLDAFYLLKRRHLVQPVYSVFLGCYLQALLPEKQEELLSIYTLYRKDHAFLTSLETLAPGLSQEDFYKVCTLLDRFSKEPSIMMQKTNMILEDQTFINEVLMMSQEDRFIHYLTLKLEQNKKLLSKLTVVDFCDDSRIGILLQKEPVMVNALSKLCEYSIGDSHTFYEVARWLLRYFTTKDEAEKQTLLQKLTAYEEKPRTLMCQQVVSLKVDDTVSLQNMYSEPLPYSFAVSGRVTFLMLLFFFFGVVFLLLGILLSFFL